jgi:hypothetical protein
MTLPKALLIDVKYFEEGLAQYLESNNLSKLMPEKITINSERIICEYLDTEVIYNLTADKVHLHPLVYKLIPIRDLEDAKRDVINKLISTLEETYPDGANKFALRFSQYPITQLVDIITPEGIFTVHLEEDFKLKLKGYLDENDYNYGGGGSYQSIACCQELIERYTQKLSMCKFIEQCINQLCNE